MGLLARLAHTRAPMSRMYPFIEYEEVIALVCSDNRVNTMPPVNWSLNLGQPETLPSRGLGD